MPNSTRAKLRRKSTAKRPKPFPGFPLFHHKSGRWAKKLTINGKPKFEYFGKVSSDTKGEVALKEWLANEVRLRAGLPRIDTGNKVEGYTVAALVNDFLNAKRRKKESGELTKRSFDDYHATGKRLTDTFGNSESPSARLVSDLRPADFDKLRASIAKQWGPVRLGNEIQKIRTIFKFGFDNEYLPTPVRFGGEFKRPNKKVLRLERAKKGPRMFEAKEIQRLLKAAGVQFKAMILLGINCGLGNADVGNLNFSHLNLEQGWLNYPRPKTGVARRCKLWPETVKRLRAAIADRPEPKGPEDRPLVFITKYGHGWAKDTRDNPVTKEFAKLLKELSLHKPGLGFYALRHTTETIGGDSKDQVAVDHVMGHARDDMSSVYRERISDERLVAVVEHVRKWLFAKTMAEK